MPRERTRVAPQPELLLLIGCSSSGNSQAAAGRCRRHNHSGPADPPGRTGTAPAKPGSLPNRRSAANVATPTLGRKAMSILVIGGTGFIGRRLVPLLAQRGEEIVCMDINPATANYDTLGKQVRVVRGDVSQFDDVMATMVAAKPERVVNLAYFLGSEYPPRVAFKLNILGMDNCFEAARLCGVRRVAYASSLAVSGEQHFYGDRVVNEDDFRHGHVQYAMHKIFNEWQAQDYREKHGLDITAIRPANVTGNDKIVGSVDHVKIITFPARGQPISFPYKDAMRCPIHVDEVAEIFARVIMADRTKHWIYNTGGVAISLGEIADMVREYLPDARISFDKDTGGKEISGNYLIDNSRLVEEFGVQYRPYRERVLQIINEVRREEGLPAIAAH
jgi:nucleoside-diphosphate-sugar epimerase